MDRSSDEIYVLYQMGASEEWTWFSVVGAFFSEDALRGYAREKGISVGPTVEPSGRNEVVLKEPQEFVAVRSKEGPVPDVELA